MTGEAMVRSDLIGRVGDGLFTTDVTGLSSGLTEKVEGDLFTTDSDLLARNEEIEVWVFLIDRFDSVLDVVLLEF